MFWFDEIWVRIWLTEHFVFVVIWQDFVNVHIFWEGHIILRNLYLTFNWHYMDKSKVEIFQNFVAFSEYNVWTLGLSWKYSQNISSRWYVVFDGLRVCGHEVIIGSPANQSLNFHASFKNVKACYNLTRFLLELTEYL